MSVINIVEAVSKSNLFSILMDRSAIHEKETEGVSKRRIHEGRKSNCYSTAKPG